MTEIQEKALLSQRDRALQAFNKGYALEELLYEETAKALLKAEKRLEFEGIRQIFHDALERYADMPHLYLLAKAFVDLLSASHTLPLPEDFAGSVPKPAKICYVKNQFLQKIVDASGLAAEWFYADDFESACMQVSDGQKDACILPYLDDEGRPLPGISKLIGEYGLKKLTLFLPENNFRFGGYLLLTGWLPTDRKVENLELQLFPASDLHLKQVLALFKSVTPAVSLPEPFWGRENEKTDALSCTLRLRLPFEDLPKTLFAARLLVPDMSVTGCYTIKHLNLS